MSSESNSLRAATLLSLALSGCAPMLQPAVDRSTYAVATPCRSEIVATFRSLSEEAESCSRGPIVQNRYVMVEFQQDGSVLAVRTNTGDPVVDSCLVAVHRLARVTRFSEATTFTVGWPVDVRSATPLPGSERAMVVPPRPDMLFSPERSLGDGEDE